MTGHINLLDTVAVNRDFPDLGLKAGEVGAVVEELSEGVFEVEFCDVNGETYAMHTLKADQLLSLHKQGQALRLQSAA